MSNKILLISLILCCSVSLSQPLSGVSVLKAKPVSSLTSEFCDNPINSWTELIYANSIPGANMYRFLVTDSGTGISEVIETPVPYFSLSQLSMALVPNHTLVVTVAYKHGKNWSSYGPPCKIFPTFVETWCGFDSILDTILEISGNQAIYDQHIQEILDQKEQLNGNTKSPYIYTIPVVFHIIDNGSSAGANFITNDEIDDQLALLNLAFEDGLSSTNFAAADVQIRFCLATQIINDLGLIETDWAPYWTGVTGGEPVKDGVTRTTSSISDLHEMDNNILNPNGMIGLADHISFPYENYLNIWIVNSITDVSIAGSILGYSPYPILSSLAPATPEAQGLLDGAVIRTDAFLGGTHPTMNSGKVLVHEIGHYLKLYHTWTDACHDPLSCASVGDFCCDTPTQYEPDWNGCTSFINTCDPVLDPIDNHMGYSQEFCRNTFTGDQKDWMFATISLYRVNLVSTGNLSLTVPDCINPLFLTNIISITSDEICEGGGVTFGATPSPGPGTFVWSFPGGTPSTSISATPTVTYPIAGVYDVSISVTVGLDNLVVTELQTVYVNECAPQTSNLGNWYYGIEAGLTFASGLAQNSSFFVGPTPNNINTPEAATSYSNSAGNLVFYADGNTIYNKNHVVMSGHAFGDIDGNDYSLTSSGSSAHRGVVGFEDPNNINTPGTESYYIFHTSANENIPVNLTNNHGLGYSHITVNGSFPDGVVDYINIRPTENYAISECVSAVSHCNGRDYWVITQGSAANLSGNPMIDNPGPLYVAQQNYFFSYLIDPTGVSSSPIANLKAPTALSNSDFYTTYKLSPNGNIFACMTAHIDGTFDVFFYEFDRATGIMAFLTSFDIPYNNNQYWRHRDIEFSEDGNIFYILTDIGLYQVDITTLLSSPSTFNFTYTDLDNLQHNAMELGPDGRVYVTRNNGTNKVSIINFPNTMNTASWSNECGLNLEGLIYTPSRSNNLSFQNQVRKIDNSAGGFVAAQHNCTEFDFTPNICGTSYLWNFGGFGSSTLYNPSFTFPGEGSYIVTFNVDGIISTETIVIDVPDPVIIGNPIIACGNPNTVDFFASPNGSFLYEWNVIGGLPATSNLSFINFVLVDPFATIILTVTDPVTGCFSTTSIHVTTDCCSTGPSIDHPFKMNSSTPGGRSEGFDVELDITQNLVYYGGNFTQDMSLGSFALTATTPKENFILQMNEQNCLGWMQKYPIFISTEPLLPVETYVHKNRPIKIRTSSSGEIYMASQVYGHSYIASIDPLTGLQTIIFTLATPGSVSNVISDFVIDEANSRIVFFATINSTTLDFSPAFSGSPGSRVFVGAIDYTGTPLSYAFLSNDVTSVSASRGLCLDNTGNFYAAIQTDINNTNLYQLDGAFVQASSPFVQLEASTALEISDMEYDITTNQLALIGLQKGGILPPFAVAGSLQYQAFLLSYNFLSSTPYIVGLEKSFEFTYPGIELFSGDVVYTYGDQTNEKLIFGNWNPITSSNIIINEADYGAVPSIKAGGIDFNSIQNILLSNGSFFETLDFDGTLLFANGTPPSATTFYAAKIDFGTGDYAAMTIDDQILEDKGIYSIDGQNTLQIESNSALEQEYISIFPNPTTGQFKIQINGITETYGAISIFNSNGSLILSNSFETVDGLVSIDLSNLDNANGIYFITVTLDDVDYHARIAISN